MQSGGVWVLPAHQNYPADAKEQLAAAATALVDLKMLDVVSKSPGDHETYGVIEPDPEKIKPGMVGVGQLVEIRDGSGNKLARLIVGKEDKRRVGGDPSGRTLRFVRKAGQDPVYRVEIDTSKFTTTFGDWIEKDLLKLSPWDVRRLGLEDYALVAVESNGRVGVQLDRKYRVDLAYDDKAAKWSLVRLEAFSGDGEPKEESLADGEELAAGKLNDLRNALGDLKIVDVARKPSGLSTELKAEESFTSDREAVTSMQQKGFMPLKTGEILSTDGETIVGMKDGVEYVLRFGAPTTVASESKPGDTKDAGSAAAGKDNPGETSGRYLLVMARFNENCWRSRHSIRCRKCLLRPTTPLGRTATPQKTSRRQAKRPPMRRSPMRRRASRRRMRPRLQRRWLSRTDGRWNARTDGSRTTTMRK